MSTIIASSILLMSAVSISITFDSIHLLCAFNRSSSAGQHNQHSLADCIAARQKIGRCPVGELKHAHARLPEQYYN